MGANGRLEKQIGLSIDFYILMINSAIAQAFIRLASHTGVPGSLQGQTMWDLRRTK